MSEETRLKIWDQYDIPSEETLYWHCGPIRIWCKTISGELWIANKNIEIDQGADNEPIPPPEDISWSRYALQKNYQKMRFVPLFPNRPVVVKVEFPFYLTKDAEAKIYTRVPLWVRIDIVGTKNLSLFEVPTIKLSNTWFGTFTEGELCYWLSSGARRTIEPDSSRPYLAICPIHMINTAEEDLSVEKICLRVSNLSALPHRCPKFRNVINGPLVELVIRGKFLPVPLVDVFHESRHIGLINPFLRRRPEWRFHGSPLHEPKYIRGFFPIPCKPHPIGIVNTHFPRIHQKEDKIFRQMKPGCHS